MLARVSARMGTSSIDRGFTSGCEAPGGIRSKLAYSFWFSRTMLFSSSWPTRKRTTAMDIPGLEVE